MEEMMTMLMGVSKAILESVIFCHQEESYWPLGDDKSLKARFDDIFAATKYTKALEHIKKLKKEKTSVSRDLQRDLDIITSNMEMAHKV